MHSYCTRSPCWSCKGSEPKATTCCQEPQSLCWASTCAVARAKSFQMDDSYPRPLMPRIASPIPGLWVHHAGPALGWLGLLTTEENHTLQPTAPYLMHAAFVNGYPPAVGHAVHAGTRTIGTVPWPGTFAYRGRGQRAHRACQNLSLRTCPWKPVEVSKPCRGLRANVSGRIFHQLPIPCSPSRFNIMAYPGNATHNMPTLVRGSYMHQHVSGLESMVTSCTPIHCPLELLVQENCSGTIPCLKTRAGGCGACSAEQHELEPVHIIAPVGSICMSQCAARLRGLAHVSHGTQLASCLLSMHQVMMWPYLCFHCMPGPPTLGDAVDTLTTAPPALGSTWVPKQLARSLQPQDLAGSNDHTPGSALWLNIPIDAAHSSALRPWGKRCASVLPALGRTRFKVASRSQPPCLEPDLRTQKMATGWQWALRPAIDRHPPANRIPRLPRRYMSHHRDHRHRLRLAGPHRQHWDHLLPVHWPYQQPPRCHRQRPASYGPSGRTVHPLPRQCPRHCLQYRMTCTSASSPYRSDLCPPDLQDPLPRLHWKQCPVHRTWLEQERQQQRQPFMQARYQPCPWPRHRRQRQRRAHRNPTLWDQQGRRRHSHGHAHRSHTGALHQLIGGARGVYLCPTRRGDGGRHYYDGTATYHN